MGTILVGIASGIAAFKVVSLVKKWQRKYKVKVITTPSAAKMLPPGAFKGVKVHSSLFPGGFDYKKVLKQRKVEHIQLADQASVILVAPATANILAKIAHGIADDLLTTVILATNAPLILCPSMNVNMWKKKETQDNITILKQRALIIHPGEGDLA